MTRRVLIKKTRKWHRLLGLILGVQFLLWTLGGLYFSWSNIDEIRGDNLRKKSAIIPKDYNYLAPSVFLSELFGPQDSLISLKLTSILNDPIYEVVFKNDSGKHVKLLEAESGAVRPALTQNEAIAVAKNSLKYMAPILEVNYLTQAHNHHEYRGRPLPAYAITFGEPVSTTVYVSKEYGNVQAFRSTGWEIFDFLWMLHTMDYQERDNFNNWLLRAFSLFGIFTILSGFALYYLTFNRKRSKIL